MRIINPEIRFTEQLPPADAQKDILKANFKASASVMREVEDLNLTGHQIYVKKRGLGKIKGKKKIKGIVYHEVQFEQSPNGTYLFNESEPELLFLGGGRTRYFTKILGVPFIVTKAVDAENDYTSYFRYVATRYYTVQRNIDRFKK